MRRPGRLDTADQFADVVHPWRNSTPRMYSSTCDASQLSRGAQLRKGNSWYVPPMLDAAMPVLAVTETCSGFFACFLRNPAMIARRSSDLPVPDQGDMPSAPYIPWPPWENAPADPVKNTFFPSSTTIFMTAICCSFNATCFLAPVSSSGTADARTCGEKYASRDFRGCFESLAFDSSTSPVDLRFFEVVVEVDPVAVRAISFG